MSRFSYWHEQCSYDPCDEWIDTYKDEYMEIDDEVWCKECFEYEHGSCQITEESENSKQGSLNFGSNGTIRVSNTGKWGMNKDG